MTAPAPGDLWTAAEVADWLRTTKRQVWRLVSSGRLPPPVRIGARQPRWDRRRLQEWWQRLSTEGTR